MSTNLNDVVTEIYQEFSDRQGRGRATIRNMSLKARLLRLLKNPASVLYRRIKNFYEHRKYIHSPLYECEKICRENSFPSSERNVFTPADKKFPDVKIAVYTIITGGYDVLKNPFYVDDELDYYVITDSPDTQLGLHGGGGMESYSDTIAA